MALYTRLMKYFIHYHNYQLLRCNFNLLRYINDSPNFASHYKTLITYNRMSFEMSQFNSNGNGNGNSESSPIVIRRPNGTLINDNSLLSNSPNGHLVHEFKRTLTLGNVNNNGTGGSKENIHDEFTYEEAIIALNGLQTNAETLDKIRKEKGSNSCQSLTKTIQFLSFLGIKPEDLSSLNVIHVSGTKGKGSTCAFTESILRNYGYKTAFYSSPHLVVVRERLRINGIPISKQQFAKYFWTVYNAIEKNKPNDMGMPPYFMFLTILAFKYFIDEKVDVCILEVGIGGEYDCTNIIQKPVVTGVTSLDYDHCSLLGNTIEKIAWQKAGIFKSSATAFTVHQTDGAMKVLRERANERGCILHSCPMLSQYPHRLKLGINGDVQKLNASLALQLSNAWIQKRHKPNYEPSTLITKNGVSADSFHLDERFILGLSRCSWPGRCQIIRCDNVTYYVDGAHTCDSMVHCSKWYIEESKLSSYHPITHIMIFNCTGDRNADNLLKSLDARFNIAIFCPNRVTNVKDVASDQSNFTVSTEKEMEQCSTNANAWKKCDKNATIVKLSCISDAINFIKQKNKMETIHVLVTGSIHLVGGVLGIIDQDLNS